LVVEIPGNYDLLYGPELCQEGNQRDLTWPHNEFLCCTIPEETRIDSESQMWEEMFEEK
jgi:hypothetical protein